MQSDVSESVFSQRLRFDGKVGTKEIRKLMALYAQENYYGIFSVVYKSKVDSSL